MRRTVLLLASALTTLLLASAVALAATVTFANPVTTVSVSSLEG